MTTLQDQLDEITANTRQLVQAERDLAGYQTGEIQAMANYTHARISLDEAVGTTLEVNHISMEEAVRGYVQRESTLPPSLPEVKKPEALR